MDKVLNQSLRIISGAAQKTSGEALQFYLGFHSMEYYYKMRAGKELVRALTCVSHPLNALLREHRQVSVRLKIVQPWSRFAENIIEKVTLSYNIMPDIWVPYNKRKLKVDFIGDRNWRESNPIMNQAVIEEYITSIKANIIIATDGSLRDNTTAWAGVVWKNNRHFYSWSTRKQGRTSSFRAESEGFEDALVWISKYGTYNDTIVLLTDSKSLVVRLKSGLVKESWVSLLDNLKSTLFITYIPGHAGITYNEAADHLAGQAKPIGHITLNTKDVSSRLREVLSDGEERKTWWSLSRLKDLGFSFGDGANCATRKTATKITTQHIMGLLTKNTLRVILRRGWPGRFIP